MFLMNDDGREIAPIKKTDQGFSRLKVSRSADRSSPLLPATAAKRSATCNLQWRQQNYGQGTLSVLEWLLQIRQEECQNQTQRQLLARTDFGHRGTHGVAFGKALDNATSVSMPPPTSPSNIHSSACRQSTGAPCGLDLSDIWPERHWAGTNLHTAPFSFDQNSLGTDSHADGAITVLPT